MTSTPSSLTPKSAFRSRMRWARATSISEKFIPAVEWAAPHANNHLALLAQSEIQPFRTQGGRKFNECHYYELPVPTDMLERLENEIVELKITLSYFIDPNPGLSASVDPQRYQSYGLRFDLRRKGESVEVF